MALKTPIISTREKRSPVSANGAGGKLSGNGYVPGSILKNLLSPTLVHDERMLVQHIREGRFQRSLSLITAFSSLLSGLEVTYEHYVGSYSQQIMYTPVFLSLALCIAGMWAVFNRRAARIFLPIVSLVTVMDGVVGFIMHVRGVARKPGGWRIPIFNIVMGPPVLAPLLFAMSGFLGLISTFLRREDDLPQTARKQVQSTRARRPLWMDIVPRSISKDVRVVEHEIREGRFQRLMGVATAISAFFSGFESLYSHYKNNFTYRIEWVPILLTPAVMIAGIGTIWSRTMARILLPVTSALALISGAVGFFYHARGVLRRPGGAKLPLQHSVWPAHFRAAAVCRHRLSRTTGKLATEGKIMKVRNRTNVVSPTTSGAKPQVDADRLPVDAVTSQPLPTRAQPGYYPGFHTLSQQAYWDEATRTVVKARVEQVPPIRFFSAEEARFMQAICDRLMPQDDRDEAHKIPIVNYIDNRLYNRNIDGYRFEDMPEDHEAHLLGLQAIEAIAQHLFRQSFIQLGPREQDQVLQTIHDGTPPAAEDIWRRMPVSRCWMLLVQDAVDAYYAHPYAWDEIGFGGPAYPRGYMRLEGGKPEPWEVEEQRYEWKAPPTSLSDVYRPIGGPGGHKAQTSGQEGTH